ncbi:MAG: hypothetical protein ACOX4W_05960 [Bacilli bacterium]
MSKIIKFPTEKIVLENKIYALYETSNYEKIIVYFNQLLEDFDFYKKTNIYDLVLSSFFNLRLFKEVIDKGLLLLTKGYESYDLLSLLLASYIEKRDLFFSSLLIEKSSLLTLPENKCFFDDLEKTNYTDIKSIKDSKRVITLLLVVFQKAMLKEMLGEFKIDKEYMLYRFYDLINSINELGYDESVISEIEKYARHIFL